MATTRQALIDRLTSLCVDPPFSWQQSFSPFGFDRQPTGVADQVFRIEVEQDTVIGGMSYSEDRTDLITFWIARQQQHDPNGARRLLAVDVTSLSAAVVRDGADAGGDYAVPDGGGVAFSHDAGDEYAVARLSLPINYEVSL